MYEGIVGSQFMFLHCWFMLRNEAKWNNWLDSMSSPNNAEEVRPGEPIKDSTLPAKIARVMGRDRVAIIPPTLIPQLVLKCCRRCKSIKLLSRKGRRPHRMMK
jgi:hypothetical protein